MATTNVTMMSVKSLTTTESDIEDGPNPTPPYVYILIEVGYIVLFVIVTYLMRKYNFMKTDDDAVTKHHRRHFEMMKRQQEDLITRQKSNENFLVANNEGKA
ncbi:uncharacterized protein CELE_F35H8.4 [Caenorhabditis elegans]|uniref:Uncharacterized protein n=1 Tax=Caenorhabditis elegans TaxID=6239 RepID=Q20083_CAEEL|nr:Uncharacterized protein CELE_F35H8.4 [Caenorhabditis elegans]CAA85326.2 Uncharacterized protein CELE_F35H8.4 [Caenorhabditis elegans]|eukprot:NP_496056.2 Uncharacterized protein CELE_F35H8.4 [Caenorhabditis elegans]